MSNKKTRILFPIAVFFVLLFLLLGLSAGIAGGLFYYNSKKQIAQAERDVKSYSLPLVSASANIAELSLKSKKSERLDIAFKEYVSKGLVDQAFFVLRDGTIIAHSHPEKVRELNGNVSADEFAYNVEIIFRAVDIKSRDAIFMDYSIQDLSIPISRQYMPYLKKYIYKKININGWAASHAVFDRNDPVGTVTFFISKRKVYAVLNTQIHFTEKLSVLLAVCSFAIAFFISLIVFVLSKLKLARYSKEHCSAEKVPADDELTLPNEPVLHSDDTADSFEPIDSLPEVKPAAVTGGHTDGAVPPRLYFEDEMKPHTAGVIYDAIPINPKKVIQ